MDSGVSALATDLSCRDPPVDTPVGECQGDVTPAVHSEKNVITLQPLYSENRSGTTIAQVIPNSGLQVLADVQQVHIEQTLELNDLLSHVESEKRYNIKLPRGETLFVGAESSSALQRLCCGSMRSFSFRLFDRSRQEVLQLVRRLACTSGVLGCYLQRLDVFAPPAQYLGCVAQEWTTLIPRFVIKDAEHKILYCIQGPRRCKCSTYRDSDFKVLSSGDEPLHLGNISHRWDEGLVNYSVIVTLPQTIDYKHKALLIGCAFLLEYMFFESSKSTTICENLAQRANISSCRRKT